MRLRVVASLFAVGGAVLVVAGAWIAYPPAGVIVGGVILLAAGVDALRPSRGDG